nr:MAG TPA: hypothetical protein [Caudoviricetes sp.]
MTMAEKYEIEDSYFQFLMRLIDNEHPQPPARNYGVLLRYMYNMEFEYIMPLDENRAYDGLNLRYLFSLEAPFDYNGILDTLDKPCSILEMIIGLAHRIETDITCEPDGVDRTSEWFWQMISSLGLENMTDFDFNSDKVIDILRCFLNRRYAKNGRGGLFTVNNYDGDMRGIEIWYQANIWLNEKIYNENFIK